MGQGRRVAEKRKVAWPRMALVVEQMVHLELGTVFADMVARMPLVDLVRIALERIRIRQLEEEHHRGLVVSRKESLPIMSS